MYSYHSNGTNAENQKKQTARNTTTLLHMKTIVNVQMRITSGTLSPFLSTSYVVDFVEHLQ